MTISSYYIANALTCLCSTPGSPSDQTVAIDRQLFRQNQGPEAEGLWHETEQKKLADPLQLLESISQALASVSMMLGHTEITRAWLFVFFTIFRSLHFLVCLSITPTHSAHPSASPSLICLHHFMSFSYWPSYSSFLQSLSMFPSFIFLSLFPLSYVRGYVNVFIKTLLLSFPFASFLHFKQNVKHTSQRYPHSRQPCVVNPQTPPNKAGNKPSTRG